MACASGGEGGTLGPHAALADVVGAVARLTVDHLPIAANHLWESC
jgi:hypothetical protein